jgi:hypothetical protein
LQSLAFVVQFFRDLFYRCVGVKLKVTTIARKAGFADQAGRGKFFHSHINTGRKAREKFVVTGNFQKRANNRHRQFANFDGVADLNIELAEQSFFNQRAFTVEKFFPAICRSGLGFAVKRKLAVERADLRKACSVRFREINHRGKKNLVRNFSAERIEKFLLRVGEFVARLHHDVRAEQSFGLLFDRAFHAAAK